MHIARMPKRVDANGPRGKFEAGGPPPFPLDFMEECMNKILIAGLLGAGLIGANGTALASDAHTRVIASTCLSCHGPDGKSKSAMPSLAGIDKAYFVAQMKAFKSGQRPASVMHRHAQGYTDQEFEKMGEYFAAMK